MNLISSVEGMQEAAAKLRRDGKRVGLVPTMGYLHAGHLSLIRMARTRTDVVVTSIFVNPTQFAPHEDFHRYPRDLDRDKAMATEAGTDLLFVPSEEEMYPPAFVTFVQTDRVSSTLEGKMRPTHFRGVTTVVAKLFHIVNPHLAVFGQKDAQQVFLIRKMVRDLNFPVEVMVAPIVREPDGLALSSRNAYLGPDERKRAAVLHTALQRAQADVEQGVRNVSALKQGLNKILDVAKPTAVDYVAVIDPETFQETDSLRPPTMLVAMAVRFGTTRLIDNALLTIPVD